MASTFWQFRSLAPVTQRRFSLPAISDYVPVEIRWATMVWNSGLTSSSHFRKMGLAPSEYSLLTFLCSSLTRECSLFALAAGACSFYLSLCMLPADREPWWTELAAKVARFRKGCQVVLLGDFKCPLWGSHLQSRWRSCVAG